MDSKSLGWPENVAYAEDKYSIYEKLIEKKSDSPFYKKKMATLFMYALSVGFYENAEEKVKSRKPYIPTNVFSETEKWLIMSVAIKKTRGLEILLDLNQVIRIAEEYANAGIRKIDENFADAILEEDLPMKLESDLRGIFGKLKLQPTIVSKAFRGSDSENPMELISKLENALRDLIWNELSRNADGTMEKALPKDMAKEMMGKWRDRMQRASKSRELFPRSNFRLIDYAEIGELYHIIRQSELWKNYFEKIFRNKIVFDGDMNQIMMMRPDEAHSRGMTSIQLEKLRAIVAHHILLINSYNFPRDIIPTV